MVCFANPDRKINCYIIERYAFREGDYPPIVSNLLYKGKCLTASQPAFHFLVCQHNIDGSKRRRVYFCFSIESDTVI